MAQMPATLATEYSGFAKDLRLYVSEYGGLRKVALSPYTHLAIITTIVCFAKWHGENWTAIPLAVLPALLGFTLAAYALLLGFGDESFRALLALNDLPEEPSQGATKGNMLMGVAAVFLHFVVIEVVALICAIVGEATPLSAFGLSAAAAKVLALIHIPSGVTPHRIFAFCGLLAFNLSVFTALAAALNIFHVVGWYVEYINRPKPQ